MATDNNNQNSINNDDQKTLHDAGVDLPGMEVQKDKKPDSPAGEVVVDIDGGAPKNEAMDKDLAKTGIKFVENQNVTPENKEDLSALAEKKMKEVEVNLNTSDLEQEFKSQVSSEAPKKTADITSKSNTLSGLLVKIKEKLGLKKTKVKTELDSLKKMKEGISQDIADIKELEESEDKIEAELEKLENIKNEMEAIEQEVNEELKD